MRLMISTLFAVLLASCSSSASTATDAATDVATAACTGQLYDACDPASPTCGTGFTCKTFTASSFSVCTQTCGTCPDQGATAVMCNGMGICKPNTPNACTPP